MRALIVVDMLNDFIDPKGKLYCGPTASAIVPFVKAKVDEFIAQGDQVVFLMDSHRPDDLEFKRFPPHCIAGTPGADLIPELAKIESPYVIYVPKTRYSGFYGTPLETIVDSLFAAGVDTYEVVGVCTSICVMDTVGGLANRDHQVVIHKAGVADFDPAAHEAALKRMTALYGAELR